MSIEGRIAIDVSFADSSDATGVQSLKKITLVDTKSYTTGKVAIVTGTVGTAVVTVAWSPMSPAYRDATGAVVSFTSISRVAFQSSRDCVTQDPDQADNSLKSIDGACAVACFADSGSSVGITPLYTAGTASYTLVLYGT